jgi:hypothetical protein
MNKLVMVLMLAVMAGCSNVTPYVAYTHMDPTPLDNDGAAWDMGCGGVKYKGLVEAKAGYCYNARGGDMLELRIEYDFIRR